MESKEIISDQEILGALHDWRWHGTEAGEGRLMLLELLAKANAGYYNSDTEEGFLSCFKLITKSRKANVKGSRFICAMVYKHSNLKPESFELMNLYRKY